MAVCTKDIDLAVAALNRGELIAIPTETVYGLAAKATLPEAVEQIFKVKKRPVTNPLILHFQDLNAALPYIDKPFEDVLSLAGRFWPGPLTLLLPKTKLVPDIITAGYDRVAIRVPAHPMALTLLKRLKAPVAAPSANPSGYISPTLPSHVENQLGDKISLILDGGSCTRGIESTILGWDTSKQPVIYRSGSITAEEIALALGKAVKILDSEGKKTEAPGMLSKHYAPKNVTLVTDNIEAAIKLHKDKKLGVIRAMPNANKTTVYKELILSKNGKLEEIAKNLYAAMHKMDSLNPDLIIIETVPQEGIGIAINDKLKRAASFK